MSGKGEIVVVHLFEDAGDVWTLGRVTEARKGYPTRVLILDGHSPSEVEAGRVEVEGVTDRQDVYRHAWHTANRDRQPIRCNSSTALRRLVTSWATKR